ncbi:GerMN domain-containing protein [Zafaria sp. Z1313]|uniref:GerMN domain-containing protein n=1 Tax=unclassified Zafaria TaxID=2828765 RepID=UPI002E76C2F1|nr:GerMN domain-containing protein [Zafaria sp. J156]MEE1621159.1 GerMN domain-containing protein [Zafaria sp. J156]
MVHASRSSRTRSRLAVLVLVAGLGAVSACSGTSSGAASTMPPAPSSAASAAVPSAGSGSPLEKLASHRLAPVYWLGERDSTVYLYREYIQAEDQGDPITTSLKHMLEQQPGDPDYFNLWSPATRIGTSINADNVITVDLSADAFRRPLDAGLAERAVQQLVYTATAAAANAGLLSGSIAPRVVVVVDGHSGYEAFGHVPLSGPLERDASLRAPIWIIDPQQDAARTAGRVVITGLSAEFSGGARWEVRRMADDGAADVVSTGRLTLGAGQLPDDQFELAVDLRPGNYEVSVWGQNAGSDERLSEDTKHVVVSD